MANRVAPFRCPLAATTENEALKEGPRQRGPSFVLAPPSSTPVWVVVGQRPPSTFSPFLGVDTIGKFGQVFEEDQADLGGGSVAVLGHDDLGVEYYTRLERGNANGAARFIFLNPRATEFLDSWENIANDAMAILRAEAGRVSSQRAVAIQGEHMEIVPKQPTAKGPADWFTGDVWIDPVAQGRNASQWALNTVHFTPGARTAWHSHSGGQTLYVTEGQGLVQSRGGDVVTIHPGDIVHTPADEWHWHGAAPEHFMAHLSVTEGDADWGTHVTDREYTGEH